MLHVTGLRYVRDHILWLRFDDGVEGEIDLAGELFGEIFEPLDDVALFSQVTLDTELGTITWPNGADFAPEFLHDHLRVSTERR